MSYLSDFRVLIFAAVLVFLITALPSIFRWVKTVRCPGCGKWFKLDYLGFNTSDKVTGHSSTNFGGGMGGFFTQIRSFIFGYASRTNADPFIREWGTALFRCAKCGCNIEIDTKRDRK